MLAGIILKMEDSKKLQFPKGFLWGSATASYQVEGGIGPVVEIPNATTESSQNPKDNRNFHYGVENNWSNAAQNGKVPAAGFACDSYNRYEEDFDIAKSLNQNAHRFSIEWARIEPEEGKFDEKEVGHYRKVLDALRERGLEAFVTLWHFTLPIWFAKKGGFENPKSPEIFARYCEYIVGKLGDKAKFWVTINEPMVYASNGYRKGAWPPFKKNIFNFMKVINNLVMSHNLAYEKIKNIDSLAQIGVAKNNIDFQANWNPLYCLLSSFLNWFWNYRFLNRIEQDFIGLNYYFHKKFGDKAIYEKSDMGWDIYPRGIYNLLIKLKRYGKPIYITENGLADAADSRHEKFVKEHLQWINKAIQDGADVNGYFYWSLLDNFEWAHGFGPRFGLVEMNYETMERKIRPSAYEYAKICKENSLEL